VISSFSPAEEKKSLIKYISVIENAKKPSYSFDSILFQIFYYFCRSKMSIVENKQKLIEQLRAEANIDRMKLSSACKDLIKFCQDHENGDALVLGWEKFHVDNPYKDKNRCVPL